MRIGIRSAMTAPLVAATRLGSATVKTSLFAAAV